MKKYKKCSTLLDLYLYPIKVGFVPSIFFIFTNLFNGLLPTLQVLVTAKIVDVSIAVLQRDALIKDIFIPIIFLFLIIIYNEISRIFISLASVIILQHLNMTFRVNLIDKKGRLKYFCIENDRIWDLISRVTTEPSEKVLKGFSVLTNIASLMIQTVSILFIVFANVWWAAFIITLVSVPLFYASIKAGEVNYNAFKEANRYERRTKYYQSILKERDYVNERSLFGFSDSYNKKFFESYEKSRKIKMHADSMYFLRSKAGSIITAIIVVTIIAILLVPLQRKSITIGLFIGLVSALVNFVQTIGWKLADNFRNLATFNEYAKDLSDFYELPEQEGAFDLPEKEEGFVFKSIEFKDVSFCYPNTDRYILDKCSFKLYANKQYAFVGVNGAGKTTITKLMTGLYDNFEGDILINDLSIRAYPLKKIKSIFSEVFQDFSKYYISVEENIMLGNLNNFQKDRMNKVIKEMNFDSVLDNLEGKEKTILGKISKGGIDISGGQWQQIALIRNLVSDAEVRILDEPSAALDPIAESNMYEMFRNICKDKGTTILITHRLGAVKLADEILVMENGKIAEMGSHSQLMGIEGGIYREMFKNQQGWYVDEYELSQI